MKDYETAVTGRPAQANNAHKNVSLSIQSRPIKATLMNDMGTIVGSADRRHSGNVSSQNHHEK